MAVLQPEPAPASAGRQIVFRVAGREFAVALQPVVEVLRHRPVTPVPSPDPAVEGILPLRGRMVTVVDARRRLGLPPRPEGIPARVIVVDGGAEGMMGLVVDEVQGVGTAGSAAVARLDLATLLRGES